MWTDQLADELHKPIIKNYPKRKVYVNGIDKIWAADLVEMQAFSKFNPGVRYLLTVIDVFTKYGWMLLRAGTRGVPGGATAPQNFAWPSQWPPKIFRVTSCHWCRSLSGSPTQTIDSSPCCKTGPSSGPPKWKCLAPPWCFCSQTKLENLSQTRSRRFSKNQSENQKSFGQTKVESFTTNVWRSGAFNFTLLRTKRNRQWSNVGTERWKKKCSSISQQTIPTNVFTFLTTLLRDTTTRGTLA